MNHLARNDRASALRLLARLDRQVGDLASFARAAVQAAFVARDCRDVLRQLDRTGKGTQA